MDATAAVGAGIELAKHDLFSIAIVIILGLAGSVVARRLKMPDIVLYLVIGIISGPALLGLVNIKADSYLNQMILTAGAAFLLFDGGSSLRLAVLKQVWVTIVVISIIGVAITGAVVAGFGALVGLPVMTALLLGATIASTDPATLVPIFKQVPVRDRVAQTVMSESAFNDAMGAIATFTIMGIAIQAGSLTGGQTENPFAGLDAGRLVLDFLWQAGIGIALGLVFGIIISLLIGHPKFGFMTPFKRILTIFGILMAFLLADMLKASGFMSVFCFGIVMGNRGTIKSSMGTHDEETIEDFVYLGSVLMRLFIFVLLGSQVDFSLIARYWLEGLAICAGLIFVARPLTVFICAGPDRRAKWSIQELLFLSWTRETGVIPAALAGMMAGLKVPGADIVASITFMAILTTILIQAPTTKWVASKLGLLVK